MKLIPYDKFIIQSIYTPEEINARLQGVVTIGSQTLYPKAVTTPFIGHMNDKGFKISLSGYDPIAAVYKRNSFSPQIIGRYDTSECGTKITVTQRITLPVILVMAIWTIGVLLGALVAVLAALQGEELGFWITVPFVMLLVMLKLAGTGFWTDADNSREIFKRINI